MAAVFILCMLGAALPLFLYPLGIAVLARLRPRPWKRDDAAAPSVSIVTVVRGAPELVAKSIENLDQMRYPGPLELVLYEDGRTSAFEEIVAAMPRDNVRTAFSDEHQGKPAGLNAATAMASGEILVFKDVDAKYPPGAVSALVRHFGDPRVGGVCGRKSHRRENVPMRSGQGAWLGFDTAVKRAEAAVGSITSNEGKVHAIRRELYRPIPPAVMDDLYTCLSVVSQGKRFVFSPEAEALIPIPSRDPTHEIERRRRIVAGSLHCMRLRREVLNPLRFGWYAAALFINKGLRRMLPFFLLGVFVSSLRLAAGHPGFAVFVACEFLFLALAAAGFAKGSLGEKTLPSLSAQAALYFIVGNLGVVLGVWDYARGKRARRWTPRKGG